MTSRSTACSTASGGLDRLYRVSSCASGAASAAVSAGIAATAPTRRVAGGPMPAAAAKAGSSSSVAITLRGGRPLDDRGRLARRTTGGDQRPAGRLKLPGRHEQHQRVDRGRDATEVGGVGRVRGARGRRRHDGEGSRDAAMGDRDPGRSRCCDRARDPRDHLARHARPRAGEQLLATPPEHERITALQPGDDPSHHRLLDEEGADPLLWDRGPTRLLPDVEAFGLRPA